jgi:hypothetical protein
VHFKPDKNGNDTAHIQLTTPALTRQRVIVFASNVDKLRPYLIKGKQLILAGRTDGDSYLAERAWEPGDYRHIHKLKVWRGDKPQTEELLGSQEDRAQRIREYESQGWRVRLF